MKIKVRLTPGAKSNSVEKVIDLLGNEIYMVRVKARPIDGAANVMLIEVVAEHFGVPKRKVSLTKGFKNRNKVIDIEV